MTTQIPRQRTRAQTRNLPVYVSVDEAATMMSLSPKTIRRWIGEAGFPPIDAAADTSGSASRTSRCCCAGSPQCANEPDLMDT